MISTHVWISVFEISRFVVFLVMFYVFEYTLEKQDFLLHTGIILIANKAEFELKTWTLTTW